MTSSIHVICVDDSPDVRAVLKMLINRAADLECVGVLASPDDLVEKTETTRADVVVLDLVIPGSNPLDKIRELAEAGSEAKVIVYSGDSDADAVDRSLAAGAAACVTKATDPRLLLDTIRKVAGKRPSQLIH